MGKQKPVLFRSDTNFQMNLLRYVRMCICKTKNVKYGETKKGYGKIFVGIKLRIRIIGSR